MHSLYAVELKLEYNKMKWRKQQPPSTIQHRKEEPYRGPRDFKHTIKFKMAQKRIEMCYLTFPIDL